MKDIWILRFTSIQLYGKNFNPKVLTYQGMVHSYRMVLGIGMRIGWIKLKTIVRNIIKGLINL